MSQSVVQGISFKPYNYRVFLVSQSVYDAAFFQSYPRNENTLESMNFQGHLFFCTPGRNRTGTNSRSSVFETDASTNSATGANGDCKGIIIPIIPCKEFL